MRAYFILPSLLERAMAVIIPTGYFNHVIGKSADFKIVPQTVSFKI